MGAGKGEIRDKPVNIGVFKIKKRRQNLPALLSKILLSELIRIR